MHHLIRVALLVATSSAIALHTNAQTGLTTQFQPNKGLVFQKDTVFKLTLRFRVQSRFALLSESGDELTPAFSDIRIRRTRLRLDGYLLSPRLQYKVQLGFSRADMDLVETTTTQVIRDAVIYYGLTRHWTVGFGQTKLPGNRQRLVSSGALQLPDRSIVNAVFTLDRDMGLFGTWESHSEHSPVLVKAAISTGEGRNANPGDEGLCYTGRVEWLPLGEFTNEGDYFEGDLERESTPKLSLAGGYSTNQDARRTAGQLGEYLPSGESRTQNVFIADAVLKYKGLAWSTEFCQREVDGDPIVGAGEEELFIYEGWGLNSQLSRMIGKKGFEVVGRYSVVMPGERIETLVGKREEAWFGLNRYINHHRIKVQSAVSYAWQNSTPDLHVPGNRWGLWFQMELGI